MIYLISDTHFNHANVIKYCNRPFTSVEEMNRTMIQNWNSVVSNDDIVIHLGDVGITRESELKNIIPQLNGHKILVRGNHDRKSISFFLDCGFEEVKPSFIFNYNGKTIFFSHRPEDRPGSIHDFYDIHMFGHIHDMMADRFPTIAQNGACLCVERWDYKPVSLDLVLKYCGQSDIVNEEL